MNIQNKKILSIVLNFLLCFGTLAMFAVVDIGEATVSKIQQDIDDCQESQNNNLNFYSVVKDLNKADCDFNKIITLGAVFGSEGGESYYVSPGISGWGHTVLEPLNTNFLYSRSELRELNITAIPGEGWSFSHWEGENITGNAFSYNNPLSLPENYINSLPSEAILEITAVFDEQSYYSKPTISIYPVSSIGETTATLKGTILDTGGENPTVVVCWARQDGGRDISKWYCSYPEIPLQPQGAVAFEKSIAGLTPGTEYYFSAAATNSAGRSWPESSLSFTTNVAVVDRPEPPVGLYNVDTTINSITLSWTKGTGARETIVVRKIGNYPASITDGERAYFGTGISFTDTGLNPSTDYYYRAWSYNSTTDKYSDRYVGIVARTASGTVLDPDTPVHRPEEPYDTPEKAQLREELRQLQGVVADLIKMIQEKKGIVDEETLKIMLRAEIQRLKGIVQDLVVKIEARKKALAVSPPTTSGPISSPTPTSPPTTSLPSAPATPPAELKEPYFFYSFNQNLKEGMTHPDVKALQQFLNSRGFLVAEMGVGSPGRETDYFDYATKQALIRFQERYSEYILLPVGLTKGSGFFGPSTRGLVNSVIIQ